jgi:ParB-like chromosome segregation protein Spo0J
MKIEMRKIEDVRPYVHNPRHNDSAVDAVAESIRVYGFRQPIVVDETYEIIVGNTRYKAAFNLGLKQVPVHVARGLTSAQVKAYRIADNRTAELADWNYELLIKELTELQQMDFDMDLTGFSTEDLQDILPTENEPGLTDPDFVPEPPDKARTQSR